MGLGTTDVVDIELARSAAHSSGVVTAAAAAAATAATAAVTAWRTTAHGAGVATSTATRGLVKSGFSLSVLKVPSSTTVKRPKGGQGG